MAADIFNAPAAGDARGIAFGTGAVLLYAAAVILNTFLKNIAALDSAIIQLAASSIVLLPYVLLMQYWSAVSLDLQEPMNLWQAVGAVLILGSTLTSRPLKPEKEQS